MFTSLAEYRLLLRQDNADRRLMKYGYENGLIGEKPYRRLCRKEKAVADLVGYLKGHWHEGKTLAQYLKRPGWDLDRVAEIDPQVAGLGSDPEAREQVEIEMKYEGYLQRQMEQTEKFRRSEEKRIPAWLDYERIPELRREAKEKLNMLRPASLGQASRISGISPADISILMVYIEGRRRGADAVTRSEE